MRVTLKEIGERAGVTASIASRVLNNKGDVRVSAETRARIIETAHELGYRPDPYAQVLQSGKSSTIILVAPQSHYLMNARKISAVRRALHATGRPVLTADPTEYGRVEDTVDFLLFTRPTAVVWLSPSWSDREFAEACRTLQARDTYLLAVDYSRPVPADVPCDAVTVDRAYGCSLAVSHLIDCVGEEVALIGRPDGGRVEGYRQALAERRIGREIIEWIADGESPRPAFEAAQRLLRAHPQVRGILCHSDLEAIGVVSAARELGRRVPEDLAIAGFDNEPWTEFHAPPLTTVAHPVEQLCSLCMSILQGRLEGSAKPWTRISVHPELLIRASTTHTR